MEQVRSIEEILAEFRKKYGDNPQIPEKQNNAESNSESISETVNPPVIAVRSRVSRRNEYGFVKIIAVQAVTALIIAAVIITLKLLNPGLFASVWEYISARAYS